jgi:hypothetical protein
MSRCDASPAVRRSKSSNIAVPLEPLGTDDLTCFEIPLRVGGQVIANQHSWKFAGRRPNRYVTYVEHHGAAR